MTIQGFTKEDFAVFNIPGLEPRMEQLIQHVRPKLTQLGTKLAPYLSVQCGEEMFSHVAKHARRTVNPPNDTWVAWASSKRGYKALPHFQIGLWSTHVFIQFAIIYECTQKDVFARHALERLDEIYTDIPDHFFWSTNHMQPDVTLHQNISKPELEQAFRRLQTVKQAEILCGVRLNYDDPRVHDGSELLQTAEATFERLLPLYRLSF